MAWIELTNQRGRKVKHYLDTTTGKNVGVLTIHDQHYHDGAAWQDVDESLIDDGLDGFAKKCDKTQHTFRIGNGGERRWYPRRNVPGEYVGITNIQYWRTQGQGSWANINLPAAVWKSNGAEWDMANLYASITNTWRRIKSEFILKDSTAPTRLRFEIVLVGLTMTSWKLYSGTDLVGSIDPPTAEDANGTAVPVTAAYDGTHIEWSVAPTGFTYPIKVDPTFTDGYGGDVDSSIDTMTYQPQPSNNYATVESMRMENLSTEYMRGLIKFDLSSLSGATINSANLYLYNLTNNQASKNFAVNSILSANSAWTEAGASHNYAIGTTRWAGDAGSDGGDDAGCGVSGTDFNATDMGTWTTGSLDPIGTEYNISLNVTQVEAWITANYGAVLRMVTSSGSSNYIASSDHATTEYRPKLVVVYTAGDASVTAVVATASAAGIAPAISSQATITSTVATSPAAMIAPTVTGGEGAVQKVYPVSDTTVGNWMTNTGATTDLFDALNETTYSDADFIKSEETPSASPCVVKLGNITDPESSTGHILRYRYGKEGGAAINITVQVRQGYVNEGSLGTLIKEWVHTNVSALTTAEQTLSGAEADSITNYTSLFVRMVGNP